MSDEARERVVHPPWCDRERCTAPEFRPALDEYRGVKMMGAHESAPIVDSGYQKDVRVTLWQGVTAWDTETFLVIESRGEMVTSLGMGDGGGGLALYALLGMEVKEKVRQYPNLYAERFPQVARAIEEEADEATADAVMPRDPVELQEQMAAEQERAEDDGPPCRQCGWPEGAHQQPSSTTFTHAYKPQDVGTETPDVGASVAGFGLTINGKTTRYGSLQEVRAAVAGLVTERLAKDPWVALDAQTLSLSFNTGAVEEALDERGDWFTVFDAYGEEPVRIRITREG